MNNQVVAIFFVILKFSSLVFAYEPKKKCTEIPLENFSYETLKDTILDPANHVTRVEDVLCRLPKAIRSSFVAGFGSKSRQQSSYENPRVILFDPKDPAKMMLSFNGDPQHRGYNNIEIMRRHIGHGQIIELTDLEIKGGKVTFNEGSPKDCRSCHGNLADPEEPLRPLFNAIPVWPGYYGSSLFFENLVTEKEKQKWIEFKKNAIRHSRYQYLEGLRNLPLKTGPIYNLPQNKALPDTMSLRNRNITKSLAKLNHLRVASLIFKTPFYKQYKYAILAALGGCGDDVAFMLPPNIRDWHSNSNFLDPLLQGGFEQINVEKIIEKKFKLVQGTFGPTLTSPQHDIFKKNFSPEYPLSDARIGLNLFWIDGDLKQEQYGASPSVISTIRYLTEGRLSPVSMETWNIDVDTGKYRFNNNNRVDFDIQAVAKILIDRDSDLKNFTYHDDDFVDENGQIKETMENQNEREDSQKKQCDTLKDLSLTALSSFVPPPAEHFIPNIGQILTNKCLRCHDTGDLGPLIPMANLSDFNLYALENRGRNGIELSRRINLSDDKEGKMPRSGHLTDAEKKVISDYVQSLLQK